MLEKDLKLSRSKKILNDNASFFKEELRREIISRFNEEKLYDGGLTIVTTLNEDFQLKSEIAFKNGLKNYTKRSGWNGPLTNLSKNQNDNLIKQFIEYKKPHGLYGDKLALITKINKNSIEVISKAEEVIKIETMNMDIIKDNDIDCRKYFKKR